jgi:hypothetical protein
MLKDVDDAISKAIEVALSMKGQDLYRCIDWHIEFCSFDNNLGQTDIHEIIHGLMIDKYHANGDTPDEKRIKIMKKNFKKIRRELFKQNIIIIFDL